MDYAALLQTEGFPSVEDVVFGPEDHCYLNCRIRDDLVYGRNRLCYRLDTNPSEVLDRIGEEDSASLGNLTKISVPDWSRIVSVAPDGGSVLVQRQLKLSDPALVYHASAEAVCTAASEGELTDKCEPISQALDQSIYDLFWRPTGIYVRFPESTGYAMARLTTTGTVERIDLDGLLPVAADVNAAGQVGFIVRQRMRSLRLTP